MIPVWPGWRWTLRELVREVLGVRHVEQVCALIERTQKILARDDADRARRAGL